MKLGSTLKKPFVFASTLTLPVVAVVSCSSYESGISGQGSSSVSPIMDQIKTSYPDYDLQYEPTGSGDGLKVGEELGSTGSTKDFGATSSMKHPESEDTWTDVRTVTFAVDAIAIGVNLPDGVTIKDGDDPIIDIFELAKLYDDNKDNNPTWEELLTNENEEDPTGSHPITPLGREGGKEASGTADGFFSTLEDYSEDLELDKNHETLVENGGETTAEANSVALTTLIDIEGSLTYLSLGYSLENESLNKDFYVASICVDCVDVDGNPETWVPTLANAQNGDYKWTRPFNIIYNVNDQETIDFVLNLFSTGVEKIIVDQGFLSLTDEQKELQFDSSDITKIGDDLLVPDTRKIPDGESVTSADLGLAL